MPNTYLQVIAHYFCRQGEENVVKALLSELAIQTRTEPMNLYYEFFQSTEDARHFVILEKYTEASGLDAHRVTPHFQNIAMKQIIPLLDDRKVESYMVSI
jgi:quinol monooxygenase YgiN